MLTLFSGRQFMHLRRALALALAAPVLLAGCSDDPEPTPKIPEPTSSSPTPTPTESETVEAESPEEFIRRWAEELQQMQATGDTAAFREMGPNCESCTSTAERVEAIYAGGGEIRWPGWTINAIRPYGKAANQFRVRVSSAPTRYRESDTGRWQTIEGGPSVRLLELEKQDSGWMMARTSELAQ